MSTTYIAKPEHQVIYKDLTALISKHSSSVSPREILAIASNMLGKIIALQDQRTTTSEKALEIVMLNIEAGSEQVMKLLAKTKGQA